MSLQYYKLRVDTDNLDTIEDVLKKYTSKYIVSLENEGKENPHTHSYIETDTKQATLRNVLRKTFGAGNSSYSLKELDEQSPKEYLAYVIKEKNYRHNLSEEVIKQAKEYDEKVKEGIKEKKQGRKTQLQKIEEMYAEELKDLPCRGFGIAKITQLVVGYFKETGILVREFAMVSIVQTLSLKYVPEYAGDLERRILDKIVLK